MSTPAEPAKSGTSENRLEHHVFGDFSKVWHLRTVWDELAAHEGDVFCTFDWCSVWWRHFADGRDLEIHAFFDNGQLVAVLPLFRYTLWVGCVPLRMIQLIGCDHSLAAAGLPVSRAYAGTVTRKLLIALAHSDPWDVLHLGPLRGYVTSNVPIAFACAAQPNVGAVIIGNRDGCLTAYTLPGSYDKYLHTMPGSERRNIGRCERRLAAEHHVEVRLPCRPDEVRATLDRLVALHQDLWRAKGRPGQFEEWPGFESFYRDMARVQMKAGRFLLVSLNVDGSTVGVESGFALGRRVHAVIRGYRIDDEWSNYSVGRMVHCATVQQAISRRAAMMDDGGGVFEYKRRLGGELHCKRSVTVLHRGWHVRLRFWLALRIAYFFYVFCRRMWIYKLRRLGFAERPIRPRRLRAGFLVELYQRTHFRLFARGGIIETFCAKRPSWCRQPESGSTAATDGSGAAPVSSVEGEVDYVSKRT